MPPWSEIFEVAWQAALVPLAVSGAIFIVGYLLAPRQPAVVGFVAFVVGFAAGNHFRNVLMLSKEPSTPLEWLPYLALAMGVAALFPRWLGLVLRLGVSGAVAWLCVSPRFRTHVEWITPALGAAIFLMGLLLERIDHVRSDGMTPLALMIAFFAASGVIMHAHSARLSDVATISGACALGIAFIANRRGSESGIMPIAAMLLPTLVVITIASTDSRVPLLSFEIVALSPVLLLPWLVAKSRLLTILTGLPFLAANGYALAKAMEFESLPSF